MEAKKRRIILVLSGKGGVGKSSVAVSLSLGFVRAGKKVALLDVDLCGPSIPRMLGLEGQSIIQSDKGWVPVVHSPNLVVMSIGFLSQDKNAAVIWRGPKKTSVIGQFINDVNWGDDIDYMIIDTPPGTSDEHITVVQQLKQYDPEGAVLVTTPQNISLGDVRREINFCQKTSLPILGLFENMSGFVCPHCKECTNLFSSGGGKALAEASKVPFLGVIPIDPVIGEAMDKGAKVEDVFKFDSDGDCSLKAVLDFVQSRISLE